jgi:hypothetical protein
MGLSKIFTFTRFLPLMFIMGLLSLIASLAIGSKLQSKCYEKIHQKLQFLVMLSSLFTIFPIGYFICIIHCCKKTNGLQFDTLILLFLFICSVGTFFLTLNIQTILKHEKGCNLNLGVLPQVIIGSYGILSGIIFLILGKKIYNTFSGKKKKKDETKVKDPRLELIKKLSSEREEIEIDIIGTDTKISNLGSERKDIVSKIRGKGKGKNPTKYRQKLAEIEDDLEIYENSKTELQNKLDTLRSGIRNMKRNYYGLDNSGSRSVGKSRSNKSSSIFGGNSSYGSYGSSSSSSRLGT